MISYLKMHQHITYVICLAIVLVTHNSYSFAPTNFFDSYDPNLRHEIALHQKPFTLGVFTECGSSTSHGRGWQGHETNMLQLYNQTEALLPMLLNPTPALAANPAVATLLQNWELAGDYPTDDGVRGHIQYSGRLDQFPANIVLWSSYNLPWDIGIGTFSVNAYLPFRLFEVEVSSWHSKTQSITASDLQVQHDLVNSLEQNLATMGNLNIESATSVGLGDFVGTLEWYNRYAQDKEDLKAVELHAKLGLSMPTGREKNIDKAFSMALGNDGAWGIPVGVGIGLEYASKFKIGGDLDFLVLLDTTKDYRLKTEESQTDFFLLNKGNATKDHGLTWKFNLYAEKLHWWKGFSSKISYEYVKHDDDRLIPESDDFSYEVVNTARSLKEWNTHNFVFSTGYDFKKEYKNARIIPYFSLIGKLPITGKKVINLGTIGAQFNLSF